MRDQALGARLYRHTDTLRGYANGYKPKTVDTRTGKLGVDVPQVRGDVDLYPSSLERGCRSERTLKLAIAEMYVKDISIRRGTQRKKEFTEKMLLNHFIQGFALDNTLREMQPNTNLKNGKAKTISL